MSEIRLHGRGGQGVVVAAEVLSNALMRQKKYCSVFPSFGIERRGTAVTAFARVADTPVREKSKCYHPDVLMIFDPSLLDKAEFYEGFRKGGVIVACGVEEDVDKILGMGVQPAKIVLVDGIGIAFETLKRNTTNMIMLGTYAKATGMVEMEDLKEAMFHGLGDSLASKNEAALQRGFDEAKVFTYDSVEMEETHEPYFLQHITSVKMPPKPAYEAPWSDTSKEYLVTPTGTWRFRRPVVDKEKCVKCGICETFCPVQCIHRDGENYCVPDYDYCKGCMICVNECPKDAIGIEAEDK